jgi:hypothetical protein
MTADDGDNGVETGTGMDGKAMMTTMATSTHLPDPHCHKQLLVGWNRASGMAKTEGVTSTGQGSNDDNGTG